MDIKEYIEANVDRWGIHQHGYVNTSQIITSMSVRELCESNSCGFYGKAWTCPPAVGTFDDCVAKLKEYENGFVYSTKHDLEDSFDFEGMMDGMKEHGEICKVLVDDMLKVLPEKRLIFSGGSCKRCENCAYPEPCRFPGEVYPTIESYGVEVNNLAASAKINYINGVNTVTYIGCILW